MATVINRAAGTIAEKYGTAVSNINTRITTGPVQKAWRARILTNRMMSGLEKESLFPNASKTLDKIKNPIGTAVDIVSEVAGVKPGPSTVFTRMNRKAQIQTHQYPDTTLNLGLTEVENSMSPYPKIYWEDSKTDWLEEQKFQNYNVYDTNVVILMNTCVSPYQSILIQNRPPEIEFRGETTWATIKSMGRNLPMYHYTSAEDIVAFNITWYCDDPDNPAEVINKCRLLESWTKANGYQNAPPVLSILWGDSDLFYGQKFILTSATYTLKNFNSHCRNRNYGKPSYNVPLTNKGLMPYSATQELIFKRVLDHNPSWDEMRYLKPNNSTVAYKNLSQTHGVVV